MSRDSFVAWPIWICYMTRSYVWHDSYRCDGRIARPARDLCICVTWLNYICVTWLNYICVTWLNYICVTWLDCDMTCTDVMFELQDLRVTYSYVWHDSIMYVWHDTIIYVRHDEFMYVWYDSIIYVWHDSYQCDVRTARPARDSFICVTWLNSICEVAHRYVLQDSFVRVMTHLNMLYDSSIEWPILQDMCVTYAYVWHDSFIYVWHDSFIYVWHDSFIYVKWLVLCYMPLSHI